MKRANTPWRAVEPATLRWSDDGAPVSDVFGDVYYCKENGLEESRYVFLHGNNLPERWQTHTGNYFGIGELGFGTGLNFLLTWQAWRELPQPRTDLHFLSIEKFPLTKQDLARALAAWPSLGALTEQLLAVYPGLLPGQHRLILEEGVRLDLWWEDASDALLDLASTEHPLIDAWYLDGFAPSQNEAMWSADVLGALATLSRQDASFATFTAAGHVRRTLSSAGFSVRKVPGYGRKRECLRGTMTAAAANPAERQMSAWDLPQYTVEKPDHVLVVGGGLAGCSTAAALASRGIRVTIVEQGALASGGSGNDQGILYTRLSRKHSALVDFALQGFQFATNFYRQMFTSGELVPQRDGELCGNFQQGHNSSELAALREALTGLAELAQILDPDQASAILGIDQPCAGYWYPGSGWLQPAAVCRALTARDDICVLENCGEVTLQHDGTQWLAMSGDKSLTQSPVAVVAAGATSQTMALLNWLPLQAIRGQVTEIAATEATNALRTGLCHQGYIAPARNGRHTIGASFNVHYSDPAPRTDDSRDNLTKLASAVPTWQTSLNALDPATLKSRVSYRCTSPDYLPVVGPVPQYDAFIDDYSDLRKNAKQVITRRGHYWPNLYVNTAHGSRGLTSTPITAELLASMICGEPLPFERTLSRALSPARFIIRDLSRNRVRR